MAAMDNELVEFLKTTLIQKQLDSLSGRKLSGFVLPLDSLFSSPEPGLLSTFFQLPQFLFVTHL
jgi:hypothetical protein